MNVASVIPAELPQLVERDIPIEADTDSFARPLEGHVTRKAVVLEIYAYGQPPAVRRYGMSPQPHRQNGTGMLRMHGVER